MTQALRNLRTKMSLNDNAIATQVGKEMIWQGKFCDAADTSLLEILNFFWQHY